MSQRAWKFTVFGEEVMGGMPDCMDVERMKCCIFQHEIAPTTFNEHIQGFLVLKDPTTLGMVQTIIDCGAIHLESVPKGQWMTQWNYCCKPGGWDPFVLGECPTNPQGSRSDLQAISALIREQIPVNTIIRDNPGYDSDFVRYARGFHMLQAVVAVPCLARHVVVLEGPPGFGKSAFAQQQWPDNVRVKKGNNGVWFNQYAGQEAVIVEDFYGWMSFDNLLDLTDRYATTVETKGSNVVLMSSTNTIVFTTNSSPELWYHYNDRLLYSALERRITDWYVFTGVGLYWVKKRRSYGPENRLRFEEIDAPDGMLPGIVNDVDAVIEG